MPGELMKGLSEQIDAAQLLLDELRLSHGCDAFERSPSAPAVRHETAYQAAIRAFRNRRARAKHFSNPDIFGEPTWDILLDLYIHQSRNDDVTVKSASIGSGATASTALRWLLVLEEQNLIVSVDDHTGGRRRLIRLTAEGYESMTRYLNEIAQ